MYETLNREVSPEINEDAGRETTDKSRRPVRNTIRNKFFQRGSLLIKFSKMNKFKRKEARRTAH